MSHQAEKDMEELETHNTKKKEANLRKLNII